MNRLAALTLLLSLGACHGAAPCLRACEDARGFWEACMDEDGVLCYGALTLACIADAETFVACEQTGFEGDGCTLADLEDGGVVYDCADPDDAVSGCKDVTREEFRLMDDEARQAERDDCMDGPEADDLLGQAIVDRDCDAFCAALGV
jgi:hypothetical protein